MDKRIFWLLIIFFFILGFFLIGYKCYTYNISFIPKDTAEVWSIETKINFEASGKPITATLHIPNWIQGYTIVDKVSASPGYGFSFIEKDGDSCAIWTKRRASGIQSIYYRIDIMKNLYDSNPLPFSNDPPLLNVQWNESEETAATQLIKELLRVSSDSLSFTRILLQRFYTENKDQNIEVLKLNTKTNIILLKLLHQAGIPAMIVNGVVLEDGRRRQNFHQILKINFDKKEYCFDLATGGRVPS